MDIEIEQRLTKAEADGLSLSLTPDGKVRIDGQQSKIKDAAAWIRQHRAAVIDYLQAKGGEVTAADGDGTEVIEEGLRFSHCPYCHAPLVAPSRKSRSRTSRGFNASVHLTSGGPTRSLSDCASA